MTYDSMASSSKTTSKQSPGLDNLEEPHRSKLKSDALPTIFFVLTKIKLGEFRGRMSLGLPFTKAELKLTHMALA